MSTTSPRRARLRLSVPPTTTLAWGALAILCLAALAAIVRAGRGLTFFGDDWAFLMRRRGFSPHTFLEPHNEHPTVIPVIVYKALRAVFGIGHFTPYLLTGALFHIAAGVLVYVYARRRLGPWLALAPAALLLFLGAAWEDIMWPFQIAFMGSVLFGIAMLLAVDAGRDKLACLMLVCSNTCSGVGVCFLVIAAVEIAFDPRRLRRAWIVAIPAAVLAVIVLGFKTSSSSTFSAPSHTVRFAIELAAAAFGSFGGLGINWGRSLALAGVAVLILATRRRPLDPRLVALGCGAAAYWLITASGRADMPGSVPDVSRYLYPGAALLLVLFATALRDSVPGSAGALVVAGATLLACISGAGLLKEGASIRMPNTHNLLPRLTALDVARGHVAPRVQVDVQTSPDIIASDYYSAVDKWGTPAPTVPQLRAEGNDRRLIFDGALVLGMGLALEPAPGGGTSGAPPRVERSAGGRVTTSGACDVFRPSGAGATLDVTLPPGAAYDITGASPQVQLRRLADGFDGEAPLAGAGAGTRRLTLPRDKLADPWHARVTVADVVRVCATG